MKKATAQARGERQPERWNTDFQEDRQEGRIEHCPKKRRMRQCLLGNLASEGDIFRAIQDRKTSGRRVQINSQMPADAQQDKKTEAKSNGAMTMTHHASFSTRRRIALTVCGGNGRLVGRVQGAAAGGDGPVSVFF